VAFDEHLKARTRAALGEVGGLTEIKMFGGLCFMVGGHMAMGVTVNDMVRLTPHDADAALTQRGVRPIDFTGRPMNGFVFVRADVVRTDRAQGLGGSRGRLRFDAAAEEVGERSTRGRVGG
jgi:hypothetical protein